MGKQPEKDWQRVFDVACNIVEEVCARSIYNWKGGHKVVLSDGRKMLSNSPDFRAVLNAEYLKLYGVEPNFGTVTYALQQLNRAKFINRTFGS